MLKFKSKLMAGAALSALLLAGCGGSGGGSDVVTGGGAPPPVANQTINDVFAYINQLIAGNDANSDPIDINGLTLATDDTADSTPVN